MFRLDDDWVFSATDLVTALRCEYQVLQRRAEKAGVVNTTSPIWRRRTNRIFTMLNADC